MTPDGQKSLMEHPKFSWKIQEKLQNIISPPLCGDSDQHLTELAPQLWQSFVRSALSDPQHNQPLFTPQTRIWALPGCRRTKENQRSSVISDFQLKSEHLGADSFWEVQAESDTCTWGKGRWEIKVRAVQPDRVKVINI